MVFLTIIMVLYFLGSTNTPGKPAKSVKDVPLDVDNLGVYPLPPPPEQSNQCISPDSVGDIVSSEVNSCGP
jgi:hypothetical protein